MISEKSYSKKPLPAVRTVGKSIVSKVGYVDNQHRINAMLREGMQLRQFRMNLDEDKISKEIMKNVDSITNDGPDIYHDKTGAIEAMRAQLDKLEQKFKEDAQRRSRAQEMASTAILDGSTAPAAEVSVASPPVVK